MINKIKVPLIVTLVVIVVRILLEEMGAPGALSNFIGVFWLAFPVAIFLEWVWQPAQKPTPTRR